MATMAAMVTMGSAPSQPGERKHDHDVRRAAAVAGRRHPQPLRQGRPRSGLRRPPDPLWAPPRAGAEAVTAYASKPVAAKASPAANVLVKGGVPVALEQQRRKVTIHGAISHGKYRVLATFNGALKPAGNVTVPVTGRVTVTCDASTLMCASGTEP